ncbi:Hint domain-containing protein [Paracoccus sp. P2]|uniref:Hint domain-containing protein n=2 Tax=Paracoccus pantotrophus TaxID=82367 RepID=A0ABX9SBL1_PARPN|nr:Hint domain-containing protein [Paracoccus pantotrophus]MDF3854574.1 Hint domain-containing protein [Paracoccus pantotrophus]RKS51465.1 Hint domain-containing protein [Paracoccus pantotrophus]SFO42516.1 Hint domain-containing protein [Paracoccus pantotrophus]
MPVTTVNLLWIGNRSLLDSSPSSNISQNQANAIDGWAAEGRDEIAPVALTGDYFGSGSNRIFRTTYQAGLLQPASRFSYTDPDGNRQSNVTLNTFLGARFAVTVHDEDGNASVVELNGVLMQMSNGDLFVRPSTDTAAAWSVHTRISKVEILGVMRLSEDTGVATIGFRAEIFESEIVCFTRGTLIECAEGPRPVESLRIGDLVRTLDNGLKPLRWIASCRLGRELKATPKLRPIRIRAGALGQGVPSSDLLVSPQHRILVRSRVAMRLFGTAEVLVAAKQLLMLDGVDIAQDLEAVEYFHFAFDRHEVVFANGAEAESLYPGTQALKAIGRSAREELFALFPDLREQATPPVAAREIVSGRQGRRLAVRHLRNGRPLVAEAARPH